MPWGTSEGGDAGDRPAHDQCVDLVRALVGAHALEVVGVAQRRVLQRDAVAAEDRAGGAADRDGLADVVELAERDLLGAQRPGVLEPTGPQRNQQAFLDLQHHVDELLLGELERRDRRTELAALQRVAQGGLVGVAGGTHRAPDDPVASLVEAGERALEAAGAGQDRVGGQPHRVEGDVALDGGAHGELRLDRGGGEAVGGRRDDEPPNALVRPRPDDRHVRDRGQADPALGAGQHPAVTVADGARGHARRVAARRRLGQPETADQIARGHARQPALLLLVGAELRDGAHRERALDGDERADAGVAGLQLHHRQAVLDRRAATAAVALEVHAEQAEVGHLLDQLPRERRGGVPARDVRADPLVDEGTHAVAHGQLLGREEAVEVEVVVGQVEVHHTASSSRAMPVSSIVNPCAADRPRADPARSTSTPGPRSGSGPRWRPSTTTNEETAMARSPQEIDAKWDVLTQIFEGDVLFIEWTAETASTRVRDGIDTFVFTDDGIRAQTLRFTPEPVG